MTTARTLTVVGIALGSMVLGATTVAGSADARPDYKAWIEETGVFLKEAVELYKRGDARAAKAKAEAAYFEIYENLEGPIRINISAKKNYELEEEFVSIRKMIVDEAPAAAIEQRIADFMAKLGSVAPVLEGGVDLVAESAPQATEPLAAASEANAVEIEPVWRHAVREIQGGLGIALDAHKRGEAKRAAELVIQTQYDHYKNSLLETAVRRFVSQKKDFQNNSGFSDVATMMRDGNSPAQVEMRIAALVQSLQEDLPSLPVVEGALSKREERKAAESSLPANDWSKLTASLVQEIDEAVALYEQGDRQGAISLTRDVYFDAFEASGMEAKIGARDANFATKLEGHFGRLVGQMKGGLSVAQMADTRAAMKEDFAAAAGMLASGRDSATALFFYSLMIIVREGMEAILIITAIIAYLVKTDNADKLRVIYNGCLTALLLSAITALLVKWVLRVSPASQEVLEGATMLLASVVLFSVSYWLVSKAEAQKWLSYIKGKVGSSLSASSLRALWFAAFLAVYREGAETVLFYQALVADSTAAGITATAAGFVVGCIVLIGLYLAMRHGAVRLPIRPFFLLSGGLLYYMSFVFAGKGVMELIEGKLFEPSLISWMPTASFIGLFPYVQTLLPQLVILLAAVAGAVVMARQRSVGGIVGARTSHADISKINRRELGDMKKKVVGIGMILGLVLGAASTATAQEKIKEYPIGAPKEINRLTIAAVYLKPVDMDPRGMDLPASQADIHLEADIHAAIGNPNGFGGGEWIPNLTIQYKLENADSGETKNGTLMPMVAKDGPHYGSNVKMMGAGNYKVTYTIDNPAKQGFGRHADAATGVGKWFQPFSVDFEFQYVPLN